MSRAASRSSRSPWSRWLRRIAVLAALGGAIAVAREQVLRRDQVRFDAQYGTGS